MSARDQDIAILSRSYTTEELAQMFLSTKDQMHEYMDGWNDLRDIITRRCPEEIAGTKHEKRTH